jgi:CRP/FNR family transcriptional regulator, cyclic AMP receptor protein
MGRLSSSKLTRLSESEYTFADGECLFREGEAGREMYVISEGAVRITKTVGSQQVELATLGRGAFLGEMALLEGMPRDASAHAVGQTIVLAIGQGGLLMRIRRDPTFALELLNRLSRRVRELNGRVLELMQSSGARAQGP